MREGTNGNDWGLRVWISARKTDLGHGRLSITPMCHDRPASFPFEIPIPETKLPMAGKFAQHPPKHTSTRPSKVSLNLHPPPETCARASNLIQLKIPAPTQTPISGTHKQRKFPSLRLTPETSRDQSSTNNSPRSRAINVLAVKANKENEEVVGKRSRYRYSRERSKLTIVQVGLGLTYRLGSSKDNRISLALIKVAFTAMKVP